VFENAGDSGFFRPGAKLSGSERFLRPHQDARLVTFLPFASSTSVWAPDSSVSSLKTAGEIGGGDELQLGPAAGEPIPAEV
jgi:hypothetical protein